MIRFACETDLMQIAQIQVFNVKNTYKGIFNDQYLNGLDFDRVYKQWQNYYRKDGDRRILVYEENGEIIGFAGVIFYNSQIDCGLLDYLHTKREYQNKGVGKKLLLASCSMMLSEGIHNMTVYCVEGNNKAKQFYKKFGAQFDGFAVKTYTGTETISNRFLIRNIDRLCAKEHRQQYLLNNNYEQLLKFVQEKFVLFGAGKYANLFFKQFGDKFVPKLIFDNNYRLHNLKINGVEVVAPKYTKYNVIITSCYTQDIEEQLRNMGYKNIVYFCPWHQYIAK